VRVYGDSTGLDPASLTAGEDVVLHLDASHGIDVADGVLATDHLTLDQRAAIDDVAVAALGRWRDQNDERFTVDGICLTWIWERDLIVNVFLPTIARALALARAVDTYRPRSLVVMARDGVTENIVDAVARSRGIETEDTGARRPPPVANPALQASRRRRGVGGLLSLGLPSMPRRGSVLLLSYWPLLPLLDRLIADRLRPAIWAQRRPTGAKRALRAAARGGWVGAPGPWSRARARSATRRLLSATADPTPVDVEGLELGACLHAQARAMARKRAAEDLGHASLFRRAFRKGRIRRVVVPYDVEPRMRLVVTLAKEAGVPTLLVAHGAYPLRHTVVDMQLSDEVALWSSTFGPTIWDYVRPLHVVGYPVPVEVAPERRREDGRPPRILLLGRAKETQTALFDDRYGMRSYVAAVEGVAAVFPDAKIIVRPAPVEGPAASARLLAAFPEMDLEIQTGGDVMEAIASCDVCLGSASTSTFQAALPGTAVIALNLSGYEWCWPLGGRTEVPIARSAEELAGHLRRWADEGRLPGRDQLLEALGVDGRDPIDGLLKLVLADPPRSPTLEPSPPGPAD